LILGGKFREKEDALPAMVLFLTIMQKITEPDVNQKSLCGENIIHTPCQILKKPWKRIMKIRQMHQNCLKFYPFNQKNPPFNKSILHLGS
jgi:hypothetical protein